MLGTVISRSTNDKDRDKVDLVVKLIATDQSIRITRNKSEHINIGDKLQIMIDK